MNRHEARITEGAKRKKLQEKPTYSPSRIALYARCPRMFALSREYESEIGKGTENLMREGQLFEGYVFGFKEDKDEGELIRRKKAETIDGIKRHADYIRPIFQGSPKIREKVRGPWIKAARKVMALGRDKYFIEEAWDEDDCWLIVQNPVVKGKPYLFMNWETPEYIIRGEADYFGPINLDALGEAVCDVKVAGQISDGPIFCDLKYTGDISRTWDFSAIKEDYLQSVFYPYMHWKRTGEVCDFAYIVVESQYDVPVVRVIYMGVTVEDFEFVEQLVEQVHGDFIYKPNATKPTCLGGYGTSRCWFLNYCVEGRKILGGLRKFKFGDLQSAFNFSPYKPQV